MMDAVETEPTAEQIRAGIRRAEQAKRRAKAAVERADAEMTEWFRAAQESRTFTVEEAAELAGLTRMSVYRMLRKADPPDLG